MIGKTIVRIDGEFLACTKCAWEGKLEDLNFVAPDKFECPECQEKKKEREANR